MKLWNIRMKCQRPPEHLNTLNQFLTNITALIAAGNSCAMKGVIGAKNAVGQNVRRREHE